MEQVFSHVSFFIISIKCSVESLFIYVKEISLLITTFSRTRNCTSWSDKPLEIGATVKRFILKPSIKLLSIAEPDSFSIIVGKSVTFSKNKTEIKKLFPSYDNCLLKKINIYITTKYELKARFI